MSIQQMLSMQKGAGNAAVSSFVNAQRDGGGSGGPAGGRRAAGDEKIMSALAGVAKGNGPSAFVDGKAAGEKAAKAAATPSAITAAIAAENPGLAQKNGHSPDSAAED